MDSRRGVLYPTRLPEFHRMVPSSGAEDLVEWFWIPEWDIDPGRVSRQHVVAFPALNLVVEPSGIELVGATTRASYRDLAGRGWAVGALLRPASVSVLTDDPAGLRDSAAAFAAPDLHAAISQVMNDDGGARSRETAVEMFSAWLIERVGAVGPLARQANTMSTMLMGDESVTRPEHAAARLSMSVRTLQRLAHRHVGLPPAAMIRRRRLQEAAERIRAQPDTDLSILAAELGYTDHSHLTNDFGTVLGITPRAYRSAHD